MNIIIVDEKYNLFFCGTVEQADNAFGIKINCTIDDVKLFCDDFTSRSKIGETLRLFKEVN